MQKSIAYLSYKHLLLVQLRRSKSWQFTVYVLCFMLFLTVFFFYNAYKHYHHSVDTRNEEKIAYDMQLQRWLAVDKGTGCIMPKTDPYDEDILYLLNVSHSKISCPGKDWVTCDNSHCFVTDEILKIFPTVECYYSDMIFVNDDVYYAATAVKRTGREIYKLEKSDHVKILCTEGIPLRFPYFSQLQKWNGIKTGFRPVQVRVPPGREDSLNVLILILDSVSHNQFVRRLSVVEEVLTEELGAVVLNNYNIVGDATPAAMFPILTGQTELELPDARKIVKKSYLAQDKFLFTQLHNDGYRTAYFEDQPSLGTFQYRYNGFKRQPSDHYLRPFMMESRRMIKQKLKAKPWDDFPFCVGALPTYILLMNLTRQFTTLKGKRFSVTLISDLSHQAFGDKKYHTDLLGTADDDLMNLLRSFKTDGILENTLLLVMSDHGSRFTNIRMTYQGKIEERLPFVSIVLPERLKKHRPDAEKNLRSNANVLTTPFDIHTTILDAVGLKHLSNNYKVPGSDLLRGLSLLEPILASRSCSEAYIHPHWCACLKWKYVPENDMMYKRAAYEFAAYINFLIAENAKCAEMEILEIKWVKREIGSYQHSVEYKALMARQKFEIVIPTVVFYQVQIEMSPGHAMFEGTLNFYEHINRFVLFEQDISRINAYGAEPNCVIRTHPHLSKYCYCKTEHLDC